MIRKSSQTFAAFWDLTPALYFGLHLLLGVSFVLYPHAIYVLLEFFFFFPDFFTKRWKRACTGLIFMTAMLLYCKYHYPNIQLPEEKLHGKASFAIASIKYSPTPFHQHHFSYRGTIAEFKDDSDQIWKKLPVVVYSKEAFYPATHDYLIEGTLVQKDNHFFIFKPDKNKAWTPLSQTSNLVQWRFQAKKTVGKFLKSCFSDAKIFSFFQALMTGEIEDRSLSLQLRKIGLQHILAISGFHFALFSLFFGALFKYLFPYRYARLLLLILLSLFFIFIGMSASILRAYVACIFFLIGQLFHLRSNALNLLGLALVMELIIDPLIITNIGFQLSFICTLGILLLFRPMEHFLYWIFPKRTLMEVQTFSHLDQYGTLISSFLRSLIALNLSAHLFSVPILLFYFHQFPLLSLCYNLFFPLCVSLSVYLFLLACLLLFLPPLSQWILHINEVFIGYFLQITANPPEVLNFNLTMNAFPFTLVVAILLVLFSLGVLINYVCTSRSSIATA